MFYFKAKSPPANTKWAIVIIHFHFSLFVGVNMYMCCPDKFLAYFYVHINNK